jgi:hypothetical protein
MLKKQADSSAIALIISATPTSVKRNIMGMNRDEFGAFMSMMGHLSYLSTVPDEYKNIIKSVIKQDN